MPRLELHLAFITSIGPLGSSLRTHPRSGFLSGGTSECTLVPVFVPGEHPPNPPFVNPEKQGVFRCTVKALRIYTLVATTRVIGVNM